MLAAFLLNISAGFDFKEKEGGNRMMKKIAFIIGGICIASLVAGSALAGTGNGIDENGKRFTLNIIAYDKDH